ncbi:MAG: hypothetical protein O8C61_13610 [Candidatus Methanoperedens sp.]|nr:hypothetical protein [Candidatus Methanoperedens sp.]
MTKKLQLYSLDRIKNIYGDEKLQEMINAFECKRNKEIERFVMYGEMENSHDLCDNNRVVSYFILDYDDKFLGLFSLFIKAFPFNDQKPKESTPVFYIPCLARHDKVLSNELNINEILDLAFGILYNVRKTIGGISTVMVDTDVEVVKNLYIEKYRFNEICNPNNDTFLLVKELSDVIP